MGARSERRGSQYGNARGIPDKQARRRRMREDDPRWQAAMAEVREQNAMIDRLAAQTEGDAALSAEARRRMPLLYEKPEAAVPEPTPVTPRTPSNAEGGRRFVLCHCGHDRPAHQNAKAAPNCVLCDCPGYRPNTAPDPLAEHALSVHNIDDLLQRAKESDVKRTVALADKIEAWLVDLSNRVNEEEEEKAEREAELARTREARERIERLERELAEARAQLAPAKKRTPRAAPAKSVPRNGKVGYQSQAPEYEQGADGLYLCPECGPAGAKETRQKVSIHRARSHGFRRSK